MTPVVSKKHAVIALVGAILGIIFASYSTFDYAKHLDRQLHSVHCSFIPGLVGVADGENACRTAMYSAYSALFRQTFWGGIPISLFGLGLYAFFAAFALSLVVGGDKVTRRAYVFLGVTSIAPLAVSVVMAVILAVKLGSFCKTCVGMYIASVLLTVGGIGGMRMISGMKAYADVSRSMAADATVPDAPDGALREGGPMLPFLWLVLMGAAVLVPVFVYAAAVPDYRPKLASCGKLSEPQDVNKSLLHLSTLHPKRPSTLFVDPLCPTCKALHNRLIDEGILDNLNASLVLFPLDSSCNWMLDRSIHPGSCLLSKALLCSEARAREVLEWMFSNQEELARQGKAGEPLLRAKIRERLGADVDACIDAKTTKIRLNNVLQYAVTNHVPVSTPQMYLGDLRICDEDTDLGLRYTMGQLAPEVLQ